MSMDHNGKARRTVSKTKFWADGVESSVGSIPLSMAGDIHTRWINRGTGNGYNEPARQDSASTIERVDKSIWDLAKAEKQDQYEQRQLAVRWTWACVKQDARVGKMLRTFRVRLFCAHTLSIVMPPAFPQPQRSNFKDLQHMPH